MQNFTCELCSRIFKSNKSKQRHIGRTHKMKEPSIESADSTCKNKYECKICGQKFRFISGWKKHEQRHEGGGFVCRTCGKGFASALVREKHREQVHKVFRCYICNLRFDIETEFLLHTESNHEGRNRELVVCNQCGRMFKTKGQLVTHLASKCGTERRFKCEECGTYLMTAGALYHHQLRHSGMRAHMCRFCAKTFLTAGQLVVHERIHTKEKAFICEVCNKGFCHRQSLITHSTLHTGIKPFRCEGCNNSFSCVGNLLKHRKTHLDTCGQLPLTTHRVQHPETRLKVQANTPDGSKLHKNKKKAALISIILAEKNRLFPEKQPDIPNTKNGEVEVTNCQSLEPVEDGNIVIQTYTLDQDQSRLKSDALKMVEQKDREYKLIDGEYIIPDGINYSEIDEVNIESRESTLEPEPDVDSCFVEELNYSPGDGAGNDDVDDNQPPHADSDDSLDLHTRLLNLKKSKKLRGSSNNKYNRPRKKKQKRIDKGGIQCKYCSRRYTEVGWLQRHERGHEKCEQLNVQEHQFKCGCCKLTFTDKDDRYRHQKEQHKDELECGICCKMFANPDSRQSHLSHAHLGVARKVYTYVCDKCGKTFSSKTTMQTHKETNCGQGKVFKCEKCDKKFGSIYSRRAHAKLHDEQKPQLCRFCGKNFIWKGQLKIHERSHTGEKPYRCQFCPKSFAYRESLITHNSIHTGIKPHICAACGSRFSCIGNLLKHRRTHAATCGLQVAVDSTDASQMLNRPKDVNMQGVQLKRVKVTEVHSILPDMDSNDFS